MDTLAIDLLLKLSLLSDLLMQTLCLLTNISVVWLSMVRYAVPVSGSLLISVRRHVMIANND